MKNRRYWNRFVFSYLFGSCSALWKSLGLIRVKSPQFPRAASQQVPGTNAKRECFVQYFPFETRSILPAHHGCLTVPTHLVRHKHRNFCQIWRATIAEYFQNLGVPRPRKTTDPPQVFFGASQVHFFMLYILFVQILENHKKKRGQGLKPNQTI